MVYQGHFFLSLSGLFSLSLSPSPLVRNYWGFAQMDAKWAATEPQKCEKNWEKYKKRERTKQEKFRHLESTIRPLS